MAAGPGRKETPVNMFRTSASLWQMHTRKKADCIQRAVTIIFWWFQMTFKYLKAQISRACLYGKCQHQLYLEVERVEK